MVTKNDIAAARERIRTSRARFNKVLAYRDKKIFERKQRINRKIIAYVIKLLEKNLNEAQLRSEMGSIKEKCIELIKITERDRYSIDVLIKVINHPYHLPAIINYFNQLAPEEKSKVHEGMASVRRLFLEMSNEINTKLIPNVDLQLNHLNEFIANENLIHLVEYIQLFKQEIILLERINEEIKPQLELIIKAWKAVSVVIKAPHHFAEQHKIAMAVFTLSILALSIILPHMHIAAGVLTSVFHGLHFVEKIGHGFLSFHHADNAINVLIS